MQKGIYYDGDYFVATAVEGVQESNPFPTQPFTKILTQKFQQLRVNPDTGAPVFKALNIGSVPLQSGMNPPEPFVGGGGVGKKGRAVPFGGGAGTGPWLVSESPRLDIGAGVVEWTRTWAHVPAMIYSFPSLNYNRQVYSVSSIPWGGNWDAYGNFHGVYRTFTAIEEWTEPTTGIVHRFFVRAPVTMKPTDMLNLFNLPTPFRIIKFNDERGREHVFELGTQGVVDSSCDVWMGDIWEIRNVY